MNTKLNFLFNKKIFYTLLGFYKESIYVKWLLPFLALLVYPVLFGLCILFLRFLRLGGTVDITAIISEENILKIIIYVIFFAPYVFAWLSLLFHVYAKIKLLLWVKILTYVMGWHMYFLQKNTYFIFMEKLYKMAFLWLSFIIHHPKIYTKHPLGFIRKGIKRLYQYPIVFIIIITFGMLIELVLTKGLLHYTLYGLFVYAMFKPIIEGLNSFATSHWERTCCVSDYVYQRWDKPRYPTRFWYWFELSQRDTQIIFEISQELEKAIELFVAKANYDQRKSDDRMFKLYKKVRRTPRLSVVTFPYKVTYYDWAHVRWTHTEIIRNTSKVLWHPMVSLCARNATDYVAIINNSWRHYRVIEQAKRVIPYQQIKKR